MPLITEIMGNLHGVKHLSKVDFYDGFWAIRIHKDDRLLTGYATREGQFRWKVAPQDYINSLTLLKKAVNQCLRDMMWKRAIPYIDDVIIYSKSFKEHLKHLEELFIKLREFNFFLKLRKCEFLMESMEFLGHTVSKEGVRHSKAKILAVMNMSTPTNPKAVKRFLGIGSFYRKYIKGYASRAISLNKLVAVEKRNFLWTEEHQKEFDDIKVALIKDQFVKPATMTS